VLSEPLSSLRGSRLQRGTTRGSMSTFLQILNYKEHYQNTAKILQIFFR